jgi:hypothetical protein
MPSRARNVLLLLIVLLMVNASAVVAQVVQKGHTRDGEILAFDDTVRIDGETRGDVIVFAGELHVGGHVSGDVVTFASDVAFSEGASIDGDLVIFGGKSSGVGFVSVTGDKLVRTRTSGTATVGDQFEAFAEPLSFFTTGVQLTLLLLWLAVTIVMTVISGREIRAASQEVRLSPMHTFTLGLVAVTSFVLTLVVFSYLIPYAIGIPLIIAAAVVGILTKVFGMIAIFHVIGSLLFGPKRREDLNRGFMRGDLALAVVGLLILGLIRLIPGVGMFVWMLASIFGIGTALATRFGRREPWFLAARYS